LDVREAHLDSAPGGLTCRMSVPIAADFFAFFWDYMLDEKEVPDLKKEWKARGEKI